MSKFKKLEKVLPFFIKVLVGLLVIVEGKKEGRDEIGQNSRLCEHL
jgi:hypothetical protein